MDSAASRRVMPDRPAIGAASIINRICATILVLVAFGAGAYFILNVIVAGG